MVTADDGTSAGGADGMQMQMVFALELLQKRRLRITVADAQLVISGNDYLGKNA